MVTKSRLLVFGSLVIALIVGAVLYNLGNVQVVRQGPAIVVVEGGFNFERTSGSYAEFGGVLTVLDGGCVGVREDGETFVAVWPNGTPLERRDGELLVDGFSVGSSIIYGVRGLTKFEKWSIPSACGDFAAVGIFDVERQRPSAGS